MFHVFRLSSRLNVAGGTIHMVCRNKDKAEEARADIVKETGNKVQRDRF